ncbi:hypothetical protein D3C85_1818750 [compost metagenome]
MIQPPEEAREGGGLVGVVDPLLVVAPQAGCQCLGIAEVASAQVFGQEVAVFDGHAGAVGGVG